MRRICWKNSPLANEPEEETMATVLTPPATMDTLADLVEQLGDIPLARIRVRPPPGTATEQDVLDLYRREKRLCELVDGVLVEKAMGFRESCLAGVLLGCLRLSVVPRNAGLVSGEAGMMRLFPGLVRIPDVAFIAWDRIPGRRMPTEPIPDLVPDLAVEVLSTSNTPREMARKCQEYFDAGVRVVWLVDPEARTVAVYTAPDQYTLYDATQTLDGGDVLPGFALALGDLFAELDRQGNG
jgi:Uma2 family endonuclease